MDENMTPELLRETGKSLFFDNKADEESRKYGLKLILAACDENDPEAAYIVAKLLFDNVLSTSKGDPVEKALKLMCSSANNGCVLARSFLNSYCEERYADEFKERYNGGNGCCELLDFNGNPIRINRKGILTPVDVTLEHKDNRNILTLSTNLAFFYGDQINNSDRFEEAVIRGIMAWQGEYEVFGGQQLDVKVCLTEENNFFDNLFIVPASETIVSTMQAAGKLIGTKERKARVSDIFANKRSFATAGLKWSSTSRKVIYIQSENGKFDDYDEIMHVAKHEFGHTLGLGDLYSSPVDSLDGVRKGTYSELDCYAITEKYYNLVMCDHHGPISNNDVEMVVLAFRENKVQIYQPSKLKKKVSAALGRGN